MWKTRVATACVLIGAFLPALFLLPRPGWLAFAALLLAQAAWEWAGLAGLQRVPRAAYAALLVIALLVLDRVVPAETGQWAYYGSAAFWFVLAPVWLWLRPAFRSPAVPLAAGILVLVPACSALVYLRDLGPGLLLAIMIAIWVSDTAAFAVGRRYGRRKLAPHISPGKTWEGVLGALAGGGVYAWAVGLFLGPRLFPGLAQGLVHTLGAWVSLLLILIVAGVVGDLMESQMKRAAGV